ncbi:hypothetical protein SAMN05443245_5856 [Paraburkholderia fungorum]|uniref:Uncharacterized protein n=1 Tax=Paraburkholderia fungorum TaxID=134537 RepID=A0A1H1IYV1_9BURK|nr:hypothetical protein [Paraburkholderia fungorum]SDR42536.1 hypothetical protein SAMN05443245_5856 [Paraburkholderia fungorum]
MSKTTDRNSNAAFKNVPRERVTDMRPPHERGNNLMRDNPPKYSEKSLIKHRTPGK